MQLPTITSRSTYETQWNPVGKGIGIAAASLAGVSLAIVLVAATVFFPPVVAVLGVTLASQVILVGAGALCAALILSTVSLAAFIFAKKRVLVEEEFPATPSRIVSPQPSRDTSMIIESLSRGASRDASFVEEDASPFVPSVAPVNNTDMLLISKVRNKIALHRAASGGAFSPVVQNLESILVALEAPEKSEEQTKYLLKNKLLLLQL